MRQTAESRTTPAELYKKTAADRQPKDLTEFKAAAPNASWTTNIAKLTPALVNLLIEHIEVHNDDKASGHCYVKVDIYFTAAGMIDIPTEQEILAMMKEFRENPQ